MKTFFFFCQTPHKTGIGICSEFRRWQFVCSFRDDSQFVSGVDTLFVPFFDPFSLVHGNRLCCLTIETKDHFIDSEARVVDKHAEDDLDVAVTRRSKLRAVNAPLLADQDRRYEGRRVSRKTLDEENAFVGEFTVGKKNEEKLTEKFFQHIS